MPTARQESTSLKAARHGDEAAFRDLVGPHRGGLLAHCYQMLGSVQDAEDALQDALLRAWLGLPQFEGRASIRSWLYTIATRTALDLTTRRRRRTLPIDDALAAGPNPAAGAPPPESAWLEPYPVDQLGLGTGFDSPDARYELRESVELAFIVAVQHLAPRQRATLLLREVVGFSTHETAETLGMTVVAVQSALERARAAVAQRCPDPSQQATLRSVGDDRVRVLVTRYMDALERADMDGMLALLVEDASWAMPPEPQWYQGHEAIRRFLAEGPFEFRWRHVPARASGQIAVGCYLWEPEGRRYAAAVLDVLTLRGPQISAITAFIDGAIFPRFGLPAVLGSDPPARS
jgi:RNA polymerase sigma-70 factor (ECF subfamily)